MDVVRNINVDFAIMKEPRGFVRVIQFVLSIFAFATLCTSATAYINVTCDNGVHNNNSYRVAIKYSYPFNLHDLELDYFCDKSPSKGTPFKSISYAPAAQFFCFIGVMSFLLCIAYCILYIVFSPVFANNSRATIVDFIFTAVWTALWFIASAAWADKLNSMGHYLDPKLIIQEDLKIDNYCDNKNTLLCKPGEAGSHATLVVSVLFGFLNMLIWGASLWFLYKETPWHKESSGDTERFDQPHGESTPGGGGEGSYQSPNPDANTTPTY